MQPKKKILFVMQLPPPVHGVSVMNKIIKDSKLINSELECHYINLATAKSINDLQKSGIRKYFLTLGIVFKTIIKMATNRYDYVYITLFPFGFAFYKDSIIVLLAKLFRTTPLLHLHTYGFKKASEKNKWKKKFYRYVFRKTEVICLSDLLLEDIEFIYQGKVYILPNGIPQVNYTNNYNAVQSPVTILYLSNLIKGKGILILMDAMEILKKKGVAYKFRVVGPEGDVSYDTLRNMITEKKLEQEIELVGPKFNAEKEAEFKQAGIFVLPSDYDTFGLVLLEAMQFGVPCISTNMGGIPDVLGGQSGIIIPEINSFEVVKALEYLIRNPEVRKQLSRSGFERYQANYTTNVFENRLKQILMGNPEVINRRLVTK